MDIYSCQSYVTVVKEMVKDKESARGGSKDLAAFLRCHPTYISQIIRGKSHFNTDQVLGFCEYFSFSEEETAFFLDLHAWERAALPASKRYFARRLNWRRGQRSNLKKRLGFDDPLSAETARRYFSDWAYQAIHMQCQIPGEHTVPSLAQALLLPEKSVKEKVAFLAEAGFISQQEDGFFHSLREAVFEGKDSALMERIHVNWRLKVAHDLSCQHDSDALHFSALVSLSQEDADKVRELIVQLLKRSRDILEPSTPESVFVYCLDFYELNAKQE